MDSTSDGMFAQILELTRGVKWGNLERMGNLERPCKSSVKGKLQVKFSVCNVSMN